MPINGLYDTWKMRIIELRPEHGSSKFERLYGWLFMLQIKLWLDKWLKEINNFIFLNLAIIIYNVVFVME